jgi:energy-coupling factor transporter ATP-binding protein EcfA2
LTLSKKEAVEEIGMVFQDPENQIVLDTVIHELAFGMENLGYDILTMKKRIGEMCNFFGLEKCFINPYMNSLAGKSRY